MSDKVSLKPHPDYPVAPINSDDIRPSTGCDVCPLSQIPGHKSAARFRLKGPLQNSQRMDAEQLRGGQFALSRRAFDAMGIVSAPGDSFYRFNSKNQFNLAYRSLYKLISISGDVVTLGPHEQGQDMRQMIFSSWRSKETQLNLYWINGFNSDTAPQPGDILAFEAPSKGEHLKCKILQITSCTDTELTLKVDKACDVALQMYPPQGEDPPPNPDFVTCAIWHYGKEAEKWDFLRKANLFIGVRVLNRLIPVGDIPANGIFKLDDGPIATPSGWDPLRPNFVLEGFNGTQWEAINENNRLHIHHDNGSFYAFGTTLPEGSIREPLTTSLTSTYSSFRVTYYRKAIDTDTNCEITGYASCDMDRVDISGSVENYGVTEGTDGNNYCAKRRYYHFETKDLHNRWPENGNPTDGIDDTVIKHTLKPKGLSDYKAGCQLYGYCNKHQDSMDREATHPDAPHLTKRDAPYTTDHTIAPALSHMIFAPDLRGEHTNFPYGGSIPVLLLHRLFHPSILGLTGYYGINQGGLQSRHGWHPNHEFRGHALWGKPDGAYVDENDNQHLRHVSGLEFGYAYPGEIDPERPGRLPELTPNFKDHRNIIDVEATVTEDLLETVGSVVERDTGEMPYQRQANRISFSLPPWDLLIPDIDLSKTEKQVQTHGSFEWGPVGQGYLRVHPLRQDAKDEVSLGTRKIALVTPLGGIRYRVQYENDDQQWSKLNIGNEQDNYDSFDEIFTIKAGGVWPIMPPEPRQIDSYNNRHKYAGSRRAGAQPGDCIKTGDKAFIIESVEPFGGDEESGYGTRKQVIEITLGGGWTPEVPQDRRPVEIIEVKNGDNEVFNVFADEEKPVLAANQAWWDEKTQSLWPSSANHGESLYIKWRTSEEGAAEQTSWFPVDEIVEIAIDLDTASWTDAEDDGKKVYIGTTELTQVGTTPEKGQVQVDTGLVKVRFRFNVDDAPATATVVLTFDEDAPAPTDDWSFDNLYTQYARKRDVTIIQCEEPSMVPPVGSVVEFLRSATVFVPQENLIVEWTPFGVDSWQPVGTGNYTVNHGTGAVDIHSAWFDQFKAPTDPENPESPLGPAQGRICFRLKQLQLMDHRGHVPASLYNKIFRMLDSEQMQWGRTRMLSGKGAWRYDYFVGQVWDWTLNLSPEGCTVAPPEARPIERNAEPGSGNSLNIGSDGDSAPFGYVTNYASLHIGSDGRWIIPELLGNIPDGAEPVEVWAMVSAAGITRTYYRTGMEEPDVTVSDTAFQFVGFTSPSQFEVLGPKIPGAKDGSRVINITAAAKIMWENRNTGKYIGYGLVLYPENIASVGGVDGLLPEGPPSYHFEPVPETPCGGYHAFDETWFINYTWGSIDIIDIYCRVDYHGKDRLSTIVQPRFCSFSAIDVPTELPA